MSDQRKKESEAPTFFEMSDQGEKQQDIPTRPPRAFELNLSSDKQFEKIYKDAYKVIDQGITLVTEGKNVQASRLFEEGLGLLDKALNIKIESLDVSAEQIQLYAEMQTKMRCTRKEVLLHFSDSQLLGTGSRSVERSHPFPGLEEAPPSYDDYLSSLKDEGATCSSQPVQYPTLNPSDFQVANPALEYVFNYEASPIVSPVLSPQNGEMIFQIENGVQIFFIYPDGKVTSPSYPSFLAIFTFTDPICSNAATGNPGARGFLQVGEWSYPLVPAQSPVLHSFYGAYMFPDPSNPQPGTSVGILIPDSVDKDTKEMFEQILNQMTSYHKQNVPHGVDADKEKMKVQKSAAQRISEGLVTGAEVVSQGVVWGAEKLSELIAFGSEKLKDTIQPDTQQWTVDPKWHKTAVVARNVSGKAVKVSGFLLNQIGKATMALGKRLAPAIQKHSTKALSRVTGQDEKNSSVQVDGVMEVASGAVKGASTIYMSLENAAVILATSLSDNTVKVVTHKYGPEYGTLTNNTLYAVGQTAIAGHNLTSLGVKGIAKKTAKDTAKALVHDYESSKAKPGDYKEVEDGLEEAMEVHEDKSVEKSLKSSSNKNL